jgi:gas vesicle protein
LRNNDKNIVTNPMVVGGVIGAAASMYAVSRMNMGQRRRMYKTGRNVARVANQVMNRMDRNFF